MINIPFYANQKDDRHCFQSCLKMILKYYFPQNNYSFNYLDKVTAHKKYKWTWDTAGMLFLSEMKLGVILIDIFDYNKFAKIGEKYLMAIWPKEIFIAQKQFSDFRQEQKLAKKIIKYINDKKIKYLRRYVTFNDLLVLSQKGYLIIVTINPLVVLKKRGYGSHSVLITNVDKKNITFHDPGLPPFKNKKVPKRLFMKALGYPHKESAALIAITLKDRL